MASVRAYVESFKFLSAAEILTAASTSQFWHQIAENEELWYFILQYRTEGLLLEATLHLHPDSKSLYRLLFTHPFIPVIVHSNYVKFRLSSKSLDRYVLPGPTPGITKASYMLFLPDMSLFVCGGDVNSSAYYDYGKKYAFRISPETNEVTKLNEMGQARRFPSAIYYRGIIYVFGGSDNTVMLLTAEQYHVSSNTWSPLPSMLYPHCSCTPCRYEQDLYLLGGYPSKKCEAFNLVQRTYRELSLELKLGVDCVSAVVGEELVALSAQQAIRWHIPTATVTHTCRIKSHDYVWTHSKPQMYKDEIWFHYWHGETIVSYNMTTNKFLDRMDLHWSSVGL